MNFYPAGTSKDDYTHPYCPKPRCISPEELEINNLFRLLWDQHAEWTGITVKSIVEGFPNEASVTARLLRNPKDFKKALAPFYGSEIATDFCNLLTEHLTLAAQLIKAMKAGRAKEADRLNREWFLNASEIAHFLGEINPYWSAKEWKDLMYMHLDLILDLTEALFNGEYEKSVEIYDNLEKEVLEMADIMAKGIIRQFGIKY